MNHSKALTIFLGIFVVMPVLLFFGLRWVARRWLSTRPSSQAAAEITPAGYVFYALQVLLLLLCTIDYHLNPTGHLGALLHTWQGMLGAIIFGYSGITVIHVILARLGYPILRAKVGKA